MKMLIDGQWIDHEEKIAVYDPFDNSVVDYIPKGTKEDAQKALTAARKGFEVSRKMKVYERANVLYKAADIVKNNLEDFAITIAKEGSKTIREAVFELMVAKTGGLLRNDFWKAVVFVVPIEVAGEKGDFVAELLDGMVLRGGLVAGKVGGGEDVFEEVVVEGAGDGDEAVDFDVVSV